MSQSLKKENLTTTHHKRPKFGKEETDVVI